MAQLRPPFPHLYQFLKKVCRVFGFKSCMCYLLCISKKHEQHFSRDSLKQQLCIHTLWIHFNYVFATCMRAKTIAASKEKYPHLFSRSCGSKQNANCIFKAGSTFCLSRTSQHTKLIILFNCNKYN